MLGKFTKRVEDNNLPTNLRSAVLIELQRTFCYPYVTLLCLVGNALLTALLWFGLPKGLLGLFFNVSEIWYFPMVLATWMISDVPATNEVAPDRIRFLEALNEPTMMTRMFRAKHLVLWIFITPLVVTVAAIIGGSTNRWVTMILVVGWVMAVPLSTLGISCFIGIYWPYHPISLKERWSRRKEWKRLWLRWGVLVVCPYVVVPIFGYIVMGPMMGFWEVAKRHHHSGDIVLAVSIALTVPVAWWIWTTGTRKAGQAAMKRADKLRSYLSDPSLG